MTPRKKGWIGVDLGTRAIKIAQVERVGARLELAGAAVVERQVASPESADVRPPRLEWSVEELRAGLSSANRRFSGRESACAVPMNLTRYHAFSIPEGTTLQRKQMIAQELADDVGEADRFEVDYWELDEQDDTSRHNVGVTYLPRQAAQAIARSLAGARLDCQVLDAVPPALARAVALVEGDEAIVGAIDWGYTTATLSIVEGGRALFTRELRNCGYQRLVDEVAKTLQLSTHDAERALAWYGLGGDQIDEPARMEMQDILAELVSTPLGHVQKQLSKTLAYLRLHRPRLVPEQFCLFGGGATIRNVEAVLSSRIDLPVKVWRLNDEKPPESEPGIPQQVLGTAVALSALGWMA